MSRWYTSNAVMNAEICARALAIRIAALSGNRSSIETTNKQANKVTPTKIHAKILAALKYCGRSERSKRRYSQAIVDGIRR